MFKMLLLALHPIILFDSFFIVKICSFTTSYFCDIKLGMQGETFTICIYRINPWIVNHCCFFGNYR